jgi:hypothetical protein
MFKFKNLFSICIFGVLFLICTTNAIKDKTLPPQCIGQAGILKSTYDAQQKTFTHCFANRTDVAKIAMMFAVPHPDDPDLPVITKEVYEKAKRYYIPWALQKVSAIASEDWDKFLANCDCDRDGYVSGEDFANSDYHCLNSCFKLEALQCLVGDKIVPGDPYPIEFNTQESPFCKNLLSDLLAEKKLW